MNWIFVSAGWTQRPMYLLGVSPRREVVWTGNEDEAMSFSTPHDAWVWISTRMIPTDVLMMQKGDPSMLERRR